MTFTWQAGRQLASLQKGTTGVSYTYSSDGTRLTKTVNGVKTSYTWDGSQLVSQTTTGGDTLYFTYHGDSQVAVEYKGNTYYYIYNLQGDVVGLVDSSGTSVVSYTYDAWGNPESITGSMASTLGAANPFRYRSYYFDTESGLYYLMSRYYDPVVGRFLNADGVIASNQDIISHNLFLYCSNNPIMGCDPCGTSDSQSWGASPKCPDYIWDAIVSSALSKKRGTVTNSYQYSYQAGIYDVYLFYQTVSETYIKKSYFFTMTKTITEWENYINNRYGYRDTISANIELLDMILGGCEFGMLASPALAMTGYIMTIAVGTLNVFYSGYMPEEVRFIRKHYMENGKFIRGGRESITIVFEVQNYDMFAQRQWVFFGKIVGWKNYGKGTHSAY